MKKTKQMILVNGALRPPTHKLVTQMLQASAGAFRVADTDARKIWLVEGKPKIFAKALGDDDFHDLLSKAERYKLPLYYVKDVEQGSPLTITCLGIGPACETQIEQLTTILDLYNWVRQQAHI